MTSYNLSTKGENVRIGNWFEEIRLKQDTGIRFYPDIKDKKGSLMTQSRCITHTEQTLPKDYSSNTRDTIVVPQKHADYRDKKTAQGPRASRMEEKIRSEIEKEYKARELNDFNETRKTNYATATKDSFGDNSFVPTLRENDPTLRIPTRTSNYSTDPAITYYSHMVNRLWGPQIRLKRVQPSHLTLFVSGFRKGLRRTKGRSHCQLSWSFAA